MLPTRTSILVINLKKKTRVLSATRVEIKLPEFLDHMAERLCVYFDEAFVTLNGEPRNNLELSCHGSQQQTFNQKFQNITDSDVNICQSSFVSLRLMFHTGGQKKIICQNSELFSTRYC